MAVDAAVEILEQRRVLVGKPAGLGVELVQCDTDQGDALRVTYVAGVCFVIAGGLVAAVTGPLGLERGSWLAAYSVLVCGVAQCALEVGHTVTGAPAPTSQLSWIRLAGWNLGTLLVIVGALLRVPILVDIGAVPLVIALVLTLRSTRHALRRISAVGYRMVLLVLIMSIPIGVTLSHARARNGFCRTRSCRDRILVAGPAPDAGKGIGRNTTPWWVSVHIRCSTCTTWCPR